jgi:hypothetical protein
VRAKGKAHAVTIYEVLDGLPPAVRDAKERTRDAFARGWASYRDGAMLEAKSSFESVLREDPSDAAARLYVERCEAYAAAGLPAGWDGVMSLASK